MSSHTIITLRRLSQLLFFAFFLFLLLNTEFRGSFDSAETTIRLPYPVSLFLEMDPLASISHALATHTLYRRLFWSLLIIIPTLFLGRFFCGWICPLGTLNHFFSSLKSEKKKGLRRIESNRYKKWQSLKYYILIVVLIAALFGSQPGGLLDPVSLTVRSLSMAVLPAVNYGFNAFFDMVYRTDIAILQTSADAIHSGMKSAFLSFKQPYFRQAFVIGLLFVVILVFNLRITRFWCRALCPLGALLGILSRWSILGLEKKAGSCGDCNKCLLNCQGGDDPIIGPKWRKAECHLCFNCVGACDEDAINFRFFPEVETTIEAPSLQRRRVITSVVAGIAMLPLLRSAPGLRVARNERLIRPPGALDEKDFLSRCIRCGECMKVCPNNALHPTLLEAGVEGIWSPMLVARIGYCEPSCVLCGQACPTGAIWEITQEEKLGTAIQGTASTTAADPIKLGTAFYDRGRCLPWAMAIDCIVCEEWCPTSPKAIYLKPEKVVDAKGVVKEVRQPYLDPERCIGCGACEYACPVQDRPAVYITSIGESRSRENQILLQQRKKSAYSLPGLGIQ